MEYEKNTSICIYGIFVKKKMTTKRFDLNLNLYFSECTKQFSNKPNSQHKTKISIYYNIIRWVLVF